METAYTYLGLSALLTILLWVPYIGARAYLWGLPTFLKNYPEGFPKHQPEPPLWAQRAERAHLNMVETMPAFIGVVVAAGARLADSPEAAAVGFWAQVFFVARIIHALVYIGAVPAARTPTYLVSWVAVLMIGRHALLG